MEPIQYRLKLGAQELALHDGETLIGRSEECTLCLDDERLSRVHAKIVLRDGRVSIQDLGSRNGTYVNDERLEASRELFPGDRIRMGKTHIRFLATGRRRRQQSSRTLGGVTMLDMGAGSATMEESDVLQRVLKLGRLDEAEKILKARVANLVRAEPPLRADHVLAQNVIRGMTSMADRTMDVRWIDRLFKLHATCTWFMSDDVQKRVEQLLRAIGRPSGEGLVAYLACWADRRDELRSEDLAQIDRLKVFSTRGSTV